MDALTASYSCKTMVTDNCFAWKSRIFPSLSKFAIAPSDIRSLKVKPEFLSSTHLPIILQRQKIYSVLSSSSLSTELKADAKTVDFQAQATYSSQTVHVRFQLKKACQFGEEFQLVGDDPMLGLWNPLNAIPLHWSEDHVWSVQLDVPVGKTLQFKLILKTISGGITWQAGPDRCLRTWETSNMIVVSEDWDNAELQKITEEELVTDLIDGSMVKQTERSLATATDGSIHSNNDESTYEIIV